MSTRAAERKRLHELPRGARIVVRMSDGNDGVLVFDHLDGMYSYCYLESDPSRVGHLHRDTPLELHEDGDAWRVVTGSGRALGSSGQH